MSEAVRLGVLGCADIAVRKVLPALAHVPSIRLVAVASRTAEKAAEVARRFGCAAIAGYEELLDRPDIDAVYVPLPPALHADWVSAALRRGKHVLAEKPLTPHPAESAALLGLATSARRVLMENIMFLHHSRHRRVRELVTAGAIGTPLAFTGSFTIPARPNGDIRNSAALGGGALLDAAIYPVVAAQVLLGELEVAGAVLQHDRELGVDVAGAALLRGAGDVTAQVVFGMWHAYTSEYQVLGDLGRITVENAYHPRADAVTEIRLRLPDGTVETLVVPPDDQCANTLEAFAQAVLNGRTGPAGDLTSRTAVLIDEMRRHAPTA